MDTFNNMKLEFNHPINEDVRKGRSISLRRGWSLILGSKGVRRWLKRMERIVMIIMFDALLGVLVCVDMKTLLTFERERDLDMRGP